MPRVLYLIAFHGDVDPDELESYHGERLEMLAEVKEEAKPSFIGADITCLQGEEIPAARAHLAELDIDVDQLGLE